MVALRRIVRISFCFDDRCRRQFGYGFPGGIGGDPFLTSMRALNQIFQTYLASSTVIRCCADMAMDKTTLAVALCQKSYFTAAQTRATSS